MTTWYKDRSFRLLDWVIVGLLGVLLVYGASWQYFRTDSDIARYQCYALAFWQGWQSFSHLPIEQCWFLTHPDPSLTAMSQADLMQRLHDLHVPGWITHFITLQDPTEPFHTLPSEYPWLMLLVYSLGLIFPGAGPGYQFAFGLWMAIIAGALYFVLQHWRSREAALMYAGYFLVGGWVTVAGRFDIIPAALTLLALMCADYKRWNRAFALLALAILSKFYPAILFVPFFIAQQQNLSARWLAWRRWKPLAVFVGVCVIVIFISLILSVANTLAPVGYFGNRPIQVEALGSSLLWLSSICGFTSLTFEHTFGSLNVVSPLSDIVSTILSGLMILGLLITWIQQWRQRFDLKLSCVLSLSIIMITGKVFSPQYLIWILPLVAYTMQGKERWRRVWIGIAFLTTLIYPFIYKMTNLLNVPHMPLFYPVVTLRNFLLLGFIVVVLVRSFLCQSSDRRNFKQLSNHPFP